jgi:CBS domain-containing protein
MRIHDVMSTGVVIGTPIETVRNVVVKMLGRHCGAIPIVSANRELLGIVTLRDVMLPMYPNYGDYIHDAVHSRDFLKMEHNYPEVLGKKAEEIMVRNPLTVSPQTPILEAASYMGLKELSPPPRR